MSSEWMTPQGLAQLLGVSDRAIRYAFCAAQRDPEYLYHGRYRLELRKVSVRGGKSGEAHEARIVGLPATIETLSVPSQTPLERPLRHDDKATWEREFRFALIMLIMAHPPRSPERVRAMTEATSRTYIGQDGQSLTFTERTINSWIENYNAQGMAGLVTRKRADAGKRKVIVTREFDKAARAITIDDSHLHSVSRSLRRYIRSLIAKAVTRKKVEFYAAGKINEFAASLGIATDGMPFSVPDHLINGERDAKNIARFRGDAKAHKDAGPYITHTVKDLPPMAIVIGDVHPGDIQVKRADGSTATIRLIGWFDVATHRLFMSVVVCDTGTGIRNAHVIQSFMDMVKAWGLPRSLYLDNGSEYKFANLLGDILKLANSGADIDVRLFERLGRVVRAQPYNAQAKGLIEGAFRILERLFRDVEGYIGGNRLLKKSANVGRPPVPFGGSFDDLQIVLANNLRFYNGNPQRGQLQGRSPDQALADLVEAGWSMTAVAEQTLMLAFTTEAIRPVRNGFIAYGGKKWTCDELLAYHGKSVIAHIPKYEKWDGIPIDDEHGNHLGIAREEQSYSYFDTAGAEESARRKKLFRDGVKSLEQQTDKIDTHDELARNVVRLPAPVRPPVGATVGATEKAAKIIAGLEETEDEARIRKAREAAVKAEAHHARMVANLERQKRNSQ